MTKPKSSKAAKVTFTTRVNDEKTVREMAVFTGKGWEAWLSYGLEIFNFCQWHGYNFEIEHHMRDLEESHASQPALAQATTACVASQVWLEY
ncbi:hypothetical protein SDRG_10650 [Saprolegnia diclina VS20]|uniref:Uncharacterized protein n=1 Tax=Saprolegnia diclina (strain VS20) TaxID=1156394 RepID=T0Q0Y8_SAPDV|nr:hypothetical protein SDRG_10650 [Saprolegnia diclina VS20]EQC31474.1 hypothetical protein SDRG_10650 [Saprolegnia diclina VS20]|eukprot:XP_008614873.1 hypothetical protein SDRG_10650 [Saprolegnia diclina VS20]